MFGGHDECEIEANKQTCLDAGQYCVDEDPELAGDWVCHCTDPYVQETPGITGPAVCVIDECLATCPTCARKADGHGYACEGQQCVDPSGMDLGDWRCDCISPALGSGLQECAVCVQDECLDTQNLQTCRDKGQECVDLHPGDTSLNNWECHCVSPALGSAIGHAAVCNINECLTYAHMQLCHENGQMCFDPDTTAESTDDWMCRCPAPAVGSAVMKPAQCVFVGECAKPEIAAVCTDVGQTCIDTDVVQDNTWVCLCVAPETGVNGIMGPAQCGSHYTTDVPETQLPDNTTDSPTQLPVGTTDLPETQLPVGTTRAPESQLPDTTDAPETQLPVGTTHIPETQLPDNTTQVPETQLPDNTTDAPQTQLPVVTTQVPETQLSVGTTDAPVTQLPVGTTHVPETQLPDNTTDAPETQIPVGTTHVPETQLPVGTTYVPETQLPDNTTHVPETQLPDNTTYAPETQLPVGTTHVPGTQLPDNTTDAPQTQLAVGTTLVPETQLPVGTTHVQETQLPVYTTDAPETQLPVGTTDAPETQLPVGSTRAPDTQLPDNTTDVPETQLSVGTTDAPETQLPVGTTHVPETELSDNTTDAPETQLPDGVTYVPSNNSAVGEADSSSSDSGSSSSLVWLIPVIVGSALVLLAGVCGAWLWVSKGRAKPEQFDDMYAMEANMLESVAMKDMDDLEELVVEDDTMY